MDAPLVTVITATYNGQRTLPFTLRSVINQDFENFEMWVVGDGCTDDSESIVKSIRDPRLNWVNLPTNSGSQSVPNNEGLRRARSQYIAFIGQDDLWFPWHLSSLIKIIESKVADFAHAFTISIGKNGKFWSKGPPRKGSSYKYHGFPPSSWLHKREIVDVIGYWRPPESLGCGIDYDFTKRAYLAGLKIVFSPELGVLKFPSPGWGFYKAESMIPQAIYFQKMLDDPNLLAYRALLRLNYFIHRNEITNYRKPLKLASTDLFGSFTWFTRSIASRLAEAYGYDRWPVSTISRFRYQHARRRRNKFRGL